MHFIAVSKTMPLSRLPFPDLALPLSSAGIAVTAATLS